MKSEDNRNGNEQVLDSELFATLISANAAWPESARQQMTAMIDQIVATDKNILSRISTGQSTAAKAGFVAEELHAETHNLDAILQRKAGRAFTDQSAEWQQTGLKGNDGLADLVVVEDGRVVHKAQSKYYQNAEKTANAMREAKDGVSKYRDADSMIAPSDQVNPSEGEQSVADAAKRTRLKNAETRPDVADAAEHVEKKVTATLKSDSGESRPLTKKEAEAVAKDSAEGRKVRKTYQRRYKTASTVQKMSGAASSAAAISAIMSGTLNTIQYLRLVREGKIDRDVAVKGIVRNTATASADSALKAAAATGAVSVVTDLSAGTVAQQAFSGMAGTTVVAGGAICTVDAIECLVSVAAGKMAPAEMETRLGKDAMQLAVAGFGSQVGLGVAASLGATAGFAPFAAGLAGAMIAGTAITIAIDNHIEKPYQEVMANARALATASYVMKETAEAMAYGQQAFACFIEMDAALDAATTEQTKRIDRAGDAMRDAIDRL